MHRSSATSTPSLWHSAIALMVTLLALAGALVGTLLLASGALLAWGWRALGGSRGPRVAAGRTAEARQGGAGSIIEGEYRIIDDGNRSGH